MCGTSDCSHNRDAAPGEARSPSWPYASVCLGILTVSLKRLTWARKMSGQLFHDEVCHGLSGCLWKAGGATTPHTSYLGGIPISRLWGSGSCWQLLYIVSDCLNAPQGTGHDCRILHAMVHIIIVQLSFRTDMEICQKPTVEVVISLPAIILDFV